MGKPSDKSVKVWIDTIFVWFCPKCGARNEEFGDFGDSIECCKCETEYSEEQWEYDTF